MDEALQVLESGNYHTALMGESPPAYSLEAIKCKDRINNTW